MAHEKKKRYEKYRPVFGIFIRILNRFPFQDKQKQFQILLSKEA